MIRRRLRDVPELAQRCDKKAPSKIGRSARLSSERGPEKSAWKLPAEPARTHTGRI